MTGMDLKTIQILTVKTLRLESAQKGCLCHLPFNTFQESEKMKIIRRKTHNACFHHLTVNRLVVRYFS
jgi:hypothetical protein